MNLTELYAKTPVERHQEIVVSGDRLFFDNEKYIIEGEERELRLVDSHKEISQKVEQIREKLGATP